MKFHLRIYDNFHYMEESEAYNFGSYETYENAISGAKAIVDEFLEHNWKKGCTEENLLAQYALYGEDPAILPDKPGEQESFSAHTYAETRAAEICLKLEAQ